MASSSSSVASSATPSSSSGINITREEFNAFHTIDRTLFARLALRLVREPFQCLQVMAFFLWLEHSGQARNLVAHLIPLPDSFINSVAEEAVLCLTCMHSEEFSSFSNEDDNTEVIPLIKGLTKDGLSLKFFHENRRNIINGVTQNITDTCTRAFEDIFAKAMENKEVLLNQQLKNAEEKMRQMRITGLYGPVVSPVYYYGHGANNPNNTSLQQQVLKDQEGVGEALGWVKHTGGSGGSTGIASKSEQEKEQVPPDDRTIFLTFSKGYPITATDVMEFFTRKFGAIIEVIHMQEVPEDGQPLFARLVLHSASSIRVVLQGKSKVKFTINGKHVWGRKYVPKTPKSPSKASSSLRQAASPAAASNLKKKHA